MLEEPSTSGTPFIACLPLDASGGVDASLSVLRHKIRELGRFAVKEEAALASARYLSDFTPDYEELRSSLLGDASGGESRATLSGSTLDFYWPTEDAWYDATCIRHVSGCTYEIEWNDHKNRVCAENESATSNASRPC